MTILFTHADCLRHNPGEGHPERPERLAAVLAALDHEDFRDLDRREAPLATREQIERVHDPDHVAFVLAAAPRAGFARLDPDTTMSPGSDHAALRAGGAVVAAVDAVMAGEARTAFCAVRPPGHHAEPERAMGFCLFNSIAVGAAHAESVWNVRKVAIVDFDVHHGNGTETMTASRPGWLYASTHQYPFYPGTGAASERGTHGNIVNAPLSSGAGSVEFRLAYQQRVLPALDAFEPELLMISAGFDAHRRDPLAGVNLDEGDFAWVTEELAKLAERHAQGRIVSVLEGGYDLEALAASTAAHVRALIASENRG
jgi:acetoin utilization deacetylase AcuC-like enzyme